VEPYTVVVGNSAMPIKRRFDPEQVRQLLQIAWWNWPIEQISAHLDLIVSVDIEALKFAGPRGGRLI
jgi:virginiamycin A acetyltransferase